MSNELEITATSNVIDITGINKAQLLAGLVNAAKPIGLGKLHDDGSKMSVEEAKGLINRYGIGHRFDYVNGKPLKLSLSGNSLDPWLYDRDQGKGSAQSVVVNIRANPLPPEKPNRFIGMVKAAFHL